MSRDRDQEAIDLLRREIPKGSTIYTVLRYRSQSGMSRRISPCQIKTADDVRDWSHSAAAALGWKMRKGEEGVVVDGCGMDMGFHLVYELSSLLHDDGYAIKHRWL